MSIATNLLLSLRLLIWSTIWSLFAHPSFAQSKNPALDSMGANIGRQNWRAATEWALKAAEYDPTEKYWRYLNAADFSSREKDAELTLKYASLVVDSDIAANAYFGKSFDWLRDDPRWKGLMDKVKVAQKREREQRIQASLPFRQYQKDLLAQAAKEAALLNKSYSTDQLYKQIRQTYPTHTYSRTGQYQYAWLQLADSIEVPYLIQLPVNFNPKKTHPVLVVLHGAVNRQIAFPDVADSTTLFFGRSFMEQASISGMIAVFPYSTRRYNWMMPDDGFNLVPQVVRQIKQMYTVDDSRVYVTGHSNGATGAFSYLMKEPTLFAGFSGVNNRPQVRTGGTFLRNGRNRSFYNIATDYDYYFPLEGHRSVTTLAHTLGVDWQNVEVSGHRNHSYLITSKDPLAKSIYQQLFADMQTKQRNPFQPQLYWECDDIKHGRCDWLEINSLDTLSRGADWHKPINVQVSGWRSVNDPTFVSDSISQAFVLLHRSGAIQATFKNNQFDLMTSKVGEATVYLSPEMVDFNRPVKVIINGKTVYDKKVSLDKAFMLAEYKKEMDHQAVWVNRLKFTIK